ncbi:MAG TPA: ATP-binding protein [Polyangiaceae bacterium]|nr:ATP-binding protein [Polyangiaceae bacterium]
MSAPFSELRPCPSEHFRLQSLAAAAHLIDAAGRVLGSHEALLEQFPCVGEHLDAIEAAGALPADGSAFDWQASLSAWCATADTELPLLALAEAADLDFRALCLWFAVGLIEDDGRFGALFEALHPAAGQSRPSAGLLGSLWREASGADGGVTARLRKLREAGLLDVTNPEAPRNQWALQVPGAIWDAARGERAGSPAPFLRHTPFPELDANEPLFSAETRAKLVELPLLLANRQLDAVVVRGPHHNGRRTLLRWLAKELERGVLELELTGKPEVDQARLRLAGPLATLLGAMPVLLLDPAPGETVELSPLPGHQSPLGVTIGRNGGVRGPCVERSITLALELPEVGLRAEQLRRSLTVPPEDVPSLAARFRMTSGNVVRAARLAEAHARLNGRERVAADDLRQAARALGRQSLDTLATRLPDAGKWAEFSAAADTLRELRILEQRCRQREELGKCVGAALAHNLNAGVRALFQGPSGTGKTLAARLLAASLDKDLYRVDLASVVNKYIGETEKNLARVFAVAEELDVVLLFDEGDALLTRRTGVSSSNDRYANLETNFLLQRMESFEGIVIVTTNASELIDGAFQRRMDAVVDFRAPEPQERWALWHLHLPSAHAVDAALLREVAARCQLTGGQIRNAVLHASLLALGDGGALESGHLEGAIQREYRRIGGVCPLRVQAPRGA